jgi:hypothetical protein
MSKMIPQDRFEVEARGVQYSVTVRTDDRNFSRRKNTIHIDSDIVPEFPGRPAQPSKDATPEERAKIEKAFRRWHLNNVRHATEYLHAAFLAIAYLLRLPMDWRFSSTFYCTCRCSPCWVLSAADRITGRGLAISIERRAA